MTANVFRTGAEVTARLTEALTDHPYLVGDRFTAADLICHSPYAWFQDAVPDVPVMRDWIARCQARPSQMRMRDFDAQAMAA